MRNLFPVLFQAIKNWKYEQGIREKKMEQNNVNLLTSKLSTCELEMRSVYKVVKWYLKKSPSKHFIDKHLQNCPWFPMESLVYTANKWILNV